jgi:membrane protease YdiL (CAAX protease family)
MAVKTDGKRAGSPVLIRIFILWLSANFIIVGAVALAAGSWYLAWPTLAGLIAEVGLIMLPNFLLPVLALRRWWPEPVGSLREALGWRWNGWRPVLVGLIGFGLSLALNQVVSRGIGESIPYQLPGRGAAVGPVEDIASLFGLLLLLAVVVGITVAGEETMFRGLIQTQIGERYGPWRGLLLGALLFGFRHLPADIFYARAWNATDRMWLARQVEVYSFGIILGLARRYGRSTYASAIAHALMYITILFG